MLAKIAAIWASFIPVAIANGFLREKGLAPLLGIRLALPLSGITGSALFFLLAYFTLPWLGTLTRRQYRLVGVSWMVMTLLFEILFGRLVVHKPWKDILAAYDLSTGNLWVLLLAVIAVSPYLVAKLRSL